MECLQSTRPVDQAWMEKFRTNAIRTRTPLSGTLELTSRCNLECVHCYLGPQEEQRKNLRKEMPAKRVISVLDQITKAGCLYLLITGGDPMMRKDFPEIYRHAKKNGLIVTVFCNGTLIREETLKLFQEFPPRKVEITLYGATAETYERITRKKGSFDKCMEGIRALANRKISFALKTVLLEPNKHEFHAIENIANEYGVKFRLDSAIFPCLLNSDSTPMNYRVSPREAVEKEMSNPERLREWSEYYERRKNIPASKRLYSCGAGVTGFYVDPYGNLSPCLMTPQYKYSLAGENFPSLWQREIPLITTKKPRNDFSCNSCGIRVLCPGCPAFNYLETGSEDARSEYVCKTTELRYQAIKQTVEEKHGNAISQ